MPTTTSMSSQNATQTDVGQNTLRLKAQPNSATQSSPAQEGKIDWKLLDQQNAELDCDLDYDSDSDEHNGGSCSCCTGREVGTIQ